MGMSLQMLEATSELLPSAQEPHRVHVAIQHSLLESSPVLRLSLHGTFIEYPRVQTGHLKPACRPQRNPAGATTLESDPSVETAISGSPQALCFKVEVKRQMLVRDSSYSDTPPTDLRYQCTIQRSEAG